MMKKLLSLAVCFLVILSFSVFASAQTVTVAVHSGHHATPWYDETPTLKEKYGIDLNVVEITADEIYSRVVLELTQQTGAYDIVQYNSAWIGDYEPYILPLDDYVAKDNDAIGFADLLPAFNKAQNMWGGKKVSVTLDGDTFLFYYRKDLFQNEEEKAAFQAKYGYELPDPPMTWQQVVDLAQFFTRKKGEKLAGQTLTKDFYGYADQAKRGRVYYWYLFRFVPFNAPNPQYFDPDTMEPNINSEGAVAALENMKELMQYSPPGVLSWEWDELYNAAMKDGTVCMWLHWTDEGRGFNQLAPLPVENAPAAELGIATNPGVKVDGKVYQYTIVDSAWVASICKDSKNPDAAYTVLKHMFGPGPVNLGYIMDAAIGWDPSRYSHFNSEEWRKKVPGIEKYLELELKALEQGYPMIKIPGAFEYNDVLDLNVSKFLAGEIATAKEALDAVAARWNELTEKFGVEKQKGFYAKMWQ
jgi:multiple sugar transport system substrate-binding protein